VTGQGIIRGWSLSTVLQMVEMDQRTCTLRVRNGENLGLLYFRGGELMDAESGPLSGIDAAYEIVNWAGEDTDIEVEGSCPADVKSIDLPITHVLLEGLTRRDEQNREAGANGNLARVTELIDGPELGTEVLLSEGAQELKQELSSLFDVSEEEAAGSSDELVATEETKEESVSKLQAVLDKFRDDVPEFVATDIVNIDSGLSIGGTTLDADFDSSVASASYAEVVKSNSRALDLLGLGADSTEDILVSTEKVLILLRLLGAEYFHVVAISRKGNLGFARAIMKKYEKPLLQAIGQLA